MPKFVHKTLEAKMASLKAAPKWNSDSSDDDDEDNNNKEETPEINKTTKKLVNKKQQKPSNVIYLGHIPKEFEERELQIFLQQFGKIRRLRLSRNIKTGNPRGFALIEFEDHDVAKIVVQTLSGYFIGNRRLVCEWISDPKPKLFFNTGKSIAKLKQLRAVEKAQRERNLSNGGKMKEITQQLVNRERKKRMKLEALGIEYDFPGYEAEHKKKMEMEETTKTSTNMNTKKEGDGKSDVGDSKGVGESESSKPPTPSKKSTPKKTPEKKADETMDEAVMTPSSDKKKKKKRKDSVGSAASEPSAAAKKKAKKSKNESSASSSETTPTKASGTKVPQSETKAKKKSKKNKRRSAP